MKIYAVLVTIIIIILIFLSIGFIQIKRKKDVIDKNWDNYKCKPYIMPFAGWLVGPADYNTSANFKQCMWQINKGFFGVLIYPFKKILDVIFEILNVFKKNIQQMRKVIKYIRNSLKEAALEISDKIKSAYIRLAYIFNKFMEVFAKVFYVFQSLFYTAVYAFYTVGSMWNGPVGGVARFFCFDKDTPITLSNGKTKKISELKFTNDKNILGIMKFDTCKSEMYNYYGKDKSQNIIVAGSHVVFENNKWVRIEDSEYVELIDDYSEKYIYCLWTKNSQIKINNIIFRDYFESNGKDVNDNITNIILNSLNNNNYYHNIAVKLGENIFNYNWGFDKNTSIKLKTNGKYALTKNISKLNIGDILENGNKVIGVIKMKCTTDMYKYNNTIVSGTQIIFNNNKWQLVSDLKNITKLTKYNRKYIYHICTDNNIININNDKYTDFEQDSGERVNNFIDSNMLNLLNM